ncbi:MAG: glycerate kinase [Clostridiales bacterium]|nr:glycerate kinase [Clostridiales bacterium]
MKIIFAPDSFKGTLSSMEVIDILIKAAKPHFPEMTPVALPVADGGEGTVDALVAALGGKFRYAEVTGPLPGMKVQAKYGIIYNIDINCNYNNINKSNNKNNADKNKNDNYPVYKTAVIEMAQASGLPLLTTAERNPLLTTTFGTGELIKAALNDGVTEIILGIGGSATNDGGIGAAAALGVRFYKSDPSLSSKASALTSFTGGNLSEISHIDISGVDPRLSKCKITVICDVKNPLTGVKGATWIFGSQKGATPEMLEILESGMISYARVVAESQIDISSIPGTGAAGGLAVPFLAFFNAQLKSGVETLLDLAGFDDLLDDTSLVVTGEGRIDGQSVFGKVPVGIASRCKKKNVPCIAIVGAIGDGATDVYEFGIDSIMSTYNKNMTLEEALMNAPALLSDASDRMFRLIKAGMKITQK